MAAQPGSAARSRSPATPARVPGTSSSIATVTNEMNVLTARSVLGETRGLRDPADRHIAAAKGIRTPHFFMDKTVDRRSVAGQRVSARVVGLAMLARRYRRASAVARRRSRCSDLPRGHRRSRMDRITGHEIVSGPVTALGRGRAVLELAAARRCGRCSRGSARSPWPGPHGGPVRSMAKVAPGDAHWDRRERRAMHPEKPTLPDRSSRCAGDALGWCAGAVFASSVGTSAALVIVLGANGDNSVGRRTVRRLEPIA